VGAYPLRAYAVEEPADGRGSSKREQPTVEAPPSGGLDEKEDQS
jgi:hypothetical protein